MNLNYEEMTRQWQDLVMDSYAAMVKDTVASPQFASASDACLDWTLSWQKQMRDQSGSFMDMLELPRRSEVARLSRQLLQAEQRLADCEEKLDEMASLVRKIGAQREAARQRRKVQ